jgi:hypothetical protein
LEIIDQERAILDAHRDQSAIAPSADETGQVPSPLGMTHDVDDGTSDPHGGDLRTPGGKVRKRRAAGQPNLVDPDHLSPLLRHPRIGERDAAEDEPLPRDHARPLHLHDQIGENLGQSRLGADADLLAETVRPDGDGRDHRGDRDGHGPADDRPKRVGETVHEMARGTSGRGGLAGNGLIGGGRVRTVETRGQQPLATGFPPSEARGNTPDSVNHAPLL